MKKLILMCVFTLLAATIVQAENEGIKVHGHWQFDIYNKDGSFDRKVEFENSLNSFGKGLLASLLSGINTAGYWRVSLEGNNDFCLSSILCNTVEASSPADEVPGITFKNLSFTNTNDTIILEGSIVTASDNQINGVSTSMYLCREIDNPRTCTISNSQLSSFTSKDLSASPVAVQAGQTVNVTVTISFS